MARTAATTKLSFGMPIVLDAPSGSLKHEQWNTYARHRSVT